MTKNKISIGTANISSLQKLLVNRALNRNRLSYGEFTRKFEKEFADLHKRKFAIFCNSGTSALQASIHALKEMYSWQDGDEIIVPAITFIASSNTIIQNKLKPVFVDIEPNYYDLDPQKIEEKITKKTKAIMPVHMFGLPCDMDPIIDIAQKNKLKIIEDSAETMFVKYKGEPVGSWGDISCFSTYVAHLVVTGVGGLATTNNSDLAIIIKSLFNHGRDGIYLSIDDDDKKTVKELFNIVERRFSFIRLGYSYRATEMEAALGVGELKRKDKMLKKRQKNAIALIRGLEKFQRYLQLPRIRPQTEHAFMMFPIVILDKKIKRNKLVFFLEKYGIETRYMMPLLNQPVYKEIFGNLEDKYPVAKNINHNGFLIGCHQGLNGKDIEYVISVFSKFFR